MMYVYVVTLGKSLEVTNINTSRIVSSFYSPGNDIAPSARLLHGGLPGIEFFCHTVYCPTVLGGPALLPVDEGGRNEDLQLQQMMG